MFEKIEHDFLLVFCSSFMKNKKELVFENKLECYYFFIITFYEK